jgi:hypothetical protein
MNQVDFFKLGCVLFTDGPLPDKLTAVTEILS